MPKARAVERRCATAYDGSGVERSELGQSRRAGGPDLLSLALSPIPMAAAARDGAAAADPLRAELADIAPLFDLYAQYSEALHKQRRYARARSLATRLLAAVEAAQALPADSLVLAVALRCVLVTRMLPVEGELGDSFEARRAVWSADPAGTLALSQRCAALLAARAAARKLFTLTPHEGAWMQMAQSVRYATLSVDTLLVMSAMEALTYWPGERFRGGLGISPELRTLLAAAIPALVEAFAHGYSMACDAAKSVYHPVLAQECFPVGIFAERCRLPDVARYANTMCDAACLKALYIRLLGSQSYPSGKVALLPPHLRFLIHDSNEESKLARFAFMTGEKVTLSAAKLSAAEAELAEAQQRMAPLQECGRKVNAETGKERVLSCSSAQPQLRCWHWQKRCSLLTRWFWRMLCCCMPKRLIRRSNCPHQSLTRRNTWWAALGASTARRFRRGAAAAPSWLGVARRTHCFWLRQTKKCG